MRSRGSLFVIIALLVGGAAVLARHHRRGAPAGAEGEVAPAAAEVGPVATPTPEPPAVPPPGRRRAPAPTAGATEAALMSALRDLGASDPARALEIARDGNRRFPNSANAAERSWSICKSLAALGLSAEAQDEARRMVDNYPGTSWARDVRRHLLAQPPNDPGAD